MRSLTPALLLALSAAADVCLDEDTCLEQALKDNDLQPESLKLLQVHAKEKEAERSDTMPHLQCEDWCKKYVANEAWLKKYPDSGPKVCKKYAACQLCDYCVKLDSGKKVENMTYAVAAKGKACGSEGYRSMDDPEACRDWCSSHEDCLAYVTYENSNCGKCVGVLHHDCTAEYQHETTCSGTITAYNKMGKATDEVEKKNADAHFKCVMGSASKKSPCTTAFETSIAEKDDVCAQNSIKCKKCNGHWCANVKYWDPKSGVKKTDSTMACVTGFTDAKDGCTSAFPINGLAKATSYCATSQSACVNCKGFWCKRDEIEYDKNVAQSKDHDAAADANAADDAGLEDEDDDGSLPGFD